MIAAFRLPGKRNSLKEIKWNASETSPSGSPSSTEVKGQMYEQAQPETRLMWCQI